MRRLLLLAVGLSVLTLSLGCSVSDKTLASAERRVKDLIAKGVPDSTLSLANVFLYQAKDSKARGRNSDARVATDTMLVLIAQAEALYKEKSAALQTTVESIRATVSAARAGLTGLPAKKLDSLVAVADSFSSIGWVLQTEGNMRKAEALIPSLKFNQARANELMPKLPGIWSCTQVDKSEANKEVNMPKTQTFTFNKDGSGSLVQEGKGRAGTHLKLDYKFINTGTWALMGDTIHLFVDRFQRVRENSQERHDKTKTKAEYWEDKSVAPCDSAITDGSQNQWITYTDLTADFKQTSKY